MRSTENTRQLNGPMVDRIRQCAADTSSSWIGAMTLYPPEARQLVALIDEGREITDLAAAVPPEVRPAFVQAVKSARAVADGDLRQQHAKIVKLHDEVDLLRADLDKSRRERDSLARRCAVRFEETQKLRGALDKIRELHTDSVAGFCPSCFRAADVSETDDGLVAYPCPTLMSIQSVVDLADLATRPNSSQPSDQAGGA